MDNSSQPQEYGGSATKARIFIVESQPVFRVGLAALFNQQPDLVVAGDTGNTLEAPARINASNPTLVTVDLALKAGNGLDFIKTLRAEHASLGILVISLLDEMLNAELALHAGANGYLMKDAPLEEVLTAVRRVLAGKIYLSEKMTYNVLAQRSRSARVREASPVSRLSHREREVLLLIGQWRRTKDIAKDTRLSIKTIEYYRSRIRTKLNLNSGNDLVRFATNWLLEHQSAGAMSRSPGEISEPQIPTYRG